jgi:CheY-like chemotaxis protein
MSGELPSILIVDDSSDDVLLLQRAFRRCNLAHPIIIVSDGEEAIAYLSGSGEYADRMTYPLPGLMMLDIRLPRKSGIEVLWWVRQQTQLRRLTVVALVQGLGSIDTTRALVAGADACLQKPVSPEDLQSVMRRMNLQWMEYPEHRQPGEEPGRGQSDGVH